MSEVFTQDENTITLDHYHKHKWLVTCTCKRLKVKCGSEPESIEVAMNHVLEHDIEYEGLNDD
jgi:hypothetical protein